SGLFYSKKVYVDDQEIMLYECASPGRMSLLLAVMAFAAEYAGYEDCYTGYYGCGMEEFFA
ncbi:MAG: hypothetical protein HDR26_09820, partial [Lachnospiraceae bacterium]|nr:hypothetical protein [Lachnospiraceae bacterium]